MRCPFAGFGFWPHRLGPRVGGVLWKLHRRRMIRCRRDGRTNRCGWPEYRWGRGPDWTTIGVIRPVTEIQRSVSVTIDDFTGVRAHQLLGDAALIDQPTRRSGR